MTWQQIRRETDADGRVWYCVEDACRFLGADKAAALAHLRKWVPGQTAMYGVQINRYDTLRLSYVNDIGLIALAIRFGQMPTAQVRGLIRAEA